jgi:hypothetical protein
MYRVSLLVTFDLEFWPQGQIGPCCRGLFDLEVKIQGQRSPTMVHGTSSGGGLPTCQIWKAYLERQKSYSPVPLLVTFDLELWSQGQTGPCIHNKLYLGCNIFVDLEVKVQGQRSPTMVCDTSAGGGLPTCQIWKACLERQKSYNPDTICYGRTDQFDLKVKGHQQWYALCIFDM